jgi:hypothetical protein
MADQRDAGAGRGQQERRAAKICECGRVVSLRAQPNQQHSQRRQLQAMGNAQTQETPACCPPGALAAQSAARCGATEPLQGKELALDSLPCYVTRPAQDVKAGIVLFHDIFGYGSARTHHVADLLAAHGYLVVCPSFFDSVDASTNTMREPEDMFWPPQRLLTGGGSEMYFRARTPWALVEPKLLKAVDFLRKESGNPLLHIGALGFCWVRARRGGALTPFRASIQGGWAVTRASGMIPCPFTCAAGVHPAPEMVQSLQSEGPTSDEMLRGVLIPQFLAPAWSDSAILRPDGWYVNYLNEPGRPSEGSESHLFAEQKHGWSVRGDVRDPAVKKDVDRVFSLVLNFYSRHLGGKPSSA